MNKPLEIATIHAGTNGGAWGITIAPGKTQAHALSGSHSRDLGTDLDAVVAWEAKAVLTLVTGQELAELRITGLGDGVKSRLMEWHHLPIDDHGTPGQAFADAWPALSLRLRGLVGRGYRVLVHCKGGLGRAGMAVARLLVEDGLAPAAAIAEVRKARGSHAVETRAQEAWVEAGKALPRVRPGKGYAARNDRAVGALVGLAAGDAVGTALEFSDKPKRAKLFGMVGGGPFGLKPGQWTDDTAMAIALGESLLAKPRLDPNDLMGRFVNWHAHGLYSCTGDCFDIGMATAAALGRYRRTGDPLAGSEDPNTAGNGSIMRLAPVAVRHWHDRSELARIADLQSVTTHAAEEARTCSVILAEIVADAIEGRPLDDILAGAAVRQVRAYRPGQPRSEVNGTGYVVASLHAAVWAVASTTSFRGAILAAANLGQDADTTAAVAGQIAGAVYGLSGIRQSWLDRLAWRQRIEDLGAGLFDASWKERA